MEIRFDYSRSFVRLLFSSRAYLNKNSCVRGTTREFLSAIAGLLTARNNKRWPCRQNHLEGANLIRSFWLSIGAFRKFFMILRRGRWTWLKALSDDKIAKFCSISSTILRGFAGIQHIDQQRYPSWRKLSIWEKTLHHHQRWLHHIDSAGRGRNFIIFFSTFAIFLRHYTNFG